MNINPPRSASLRTTTLDPEDKTETTTLDPSEEETTITTTTEGLLPPIKGAKRYCTQASDGTPIWEVPELKLCRSKETDEAESHASQLVEQTKEGKNINESVLSEAAEKIDSFLNHAVSDKKVNLLAVT